MTNKENDVTTAMQKPTNTTTDDPVDALLKSIDMGPAVPRDIIQMKMENEQLFAEARLHKRDYAQLLADIRSQCAAYRSFALTAMYARDVGLDPETKQRKIARGLSIRAAEAIQCALGCNRLSVALTPLNKAEVLVSVTFTDFLNLTTQTRQEIVSRVYEGWEYVGGKKTGKRITKTTEESRFNATVVMAAVSRCARESILRSTPPGLRSEMEIAVKEACESFMDDATFQRVVAKFTAKGVTQTQLEAYLGKRADNWSVPDRVDLLELWNGIESGDIEPTSVGRTDAGDETPPITPKAPAEPAAPAASKSMRDAKAVIRDCCGDGGLPEAKIDELLTAGEWSDMAELLGNGDEGRVCDTAKAFTAAKAAMKAPAPTTKGKGKHKDEQGDSLPSDDAPKTNLDAFNQ